MCIISPRYAGVPVDFEEVALDSSVSDENELENALLAIKRNGIALKGKYRILFHYGTPNDSLVYKHGCHYLFLICYFGYICCANWSIIFQY